MPPSSAEPTPRPDGYVSDVRALVGHRLLLLPAVSVHIRDDDGRLLLVHQVDRHQWGTIGGADVEPGESREAAVREERGGDRARGRADRVGGGAGGPDFEMTYPTSRPPSIIFDAAFWVAKLAADGVELRSRWLARDSWRSRTSAP